MRHFLADRTSGRVYGTMLCPSVCLSSVTYVLWLNRRKAFQPSRLTGMRLWERL